MLISDVIAELIEQMLEESDGILELQRNELATKVGCVPSQINYVITSRFSQNRGYIVESRRGGGGFIRIQKIKLDKNRYLMHMLAAVDNSLDQQTSRVLTSSLLENGIITEREFRIISTMLTDNALSAVNDKSLRDSLRAELFKSVILNLVSEKK